MAKGIPFASGSISAGLSHTQLITLLEWIHDLPQLNDDAGVHHYLLRLQQESAVSALWIQHGLASANGWSGPTRLLGQAGGDCDIDCSQLGGHSQYFPLQGAACFGLRRDGMATLLFVAGDDNPSQLRMLGNLLPHLHQVLQRLAPAAGNGNPLSLREKDIFHWMMRGKTNWEIATILDISERTVKFHAANIIRKLDANNRTHAIVLGLQLGLAD